MKRLPALARREPSAILFVAQICAVSLYPFVEGSDVGRALFSVFGIAFLGLVALAVLAYVAMVVSRLVGLLVMGRRAAD